MGLGPVAPAVLLGGNLLVCGVLTTGTGHVSIPANDSAGRVLRVVMDLVMTVSQLSGCFLIACSAGAEVGNTTVAGTVGCQFNGLVPVSMR